MTRRRARVVLRLTTGRRRKRRRQIRNYASGGAVIVHPFGPPHPSPFGPFLPGAPPLGGIVETAVLAARDAELRRMAQR